MNQNKIEEWFASRKKLRNDRNATFVYNQLIGGNRAALSASITILESSLESDQSIGNELIKMCLPHSGKSLRIGITGVPGVGKSTFIEIFGQHLLALGKKIAVLAIDPTSERTGGSILGDKTRMQQLSQEQNVFIRPSAAGNTLGGVARKTRESIILCEAAGYDIILIETVGVGQSEIMVHSMVDFFLLLTLAGAGDELQGIKRGIMEMADGLAVTKSDGENKMRTNLAARELKNAIHMFPPNSNGWIPEVKTCSSVTGEHILDIWEMIERFHRHTTLNGSFLEHRKGQDRFWLHETIKDLLLNGLKNNLEVKKAIENEELALSSGLVTPFEAAERIYSIYRNANSL